MKFNIKITKILEGHIEIEAENHLDALKAVEALYNGGAELPDMDDCKPLMFSVVEPSLQMQMDHVMEEKPYDEEVRNYLIKQGYPEPSEGLIDEFLNGGADQNMYDEAVRNNYCMADVDRWFHLKNLFKESISFGAAMMIDNALWAEEYESMEINEIAQIFDTPEHICENRIKMLVDIFSKDGTVIPNEFDVKDQDVLALAKVFDLPIKLPEVQKSSLSSLISSAENRASASESESFTKTQSQDLAL